MQELSGRTALVSGGGRGIGRGISEVLAGAGARVAVNYTRDREAADETVRAITEAGGHAEAFRASVTDRTSWPPWSRPSANGPVPRSTSS